MECACTHQVSALLPVIHSSRQFQKVSVFSVALSCYFHLMVSIYIYIYICILTSSVVFILPAHLLCHSLTQLQLSSLFISHLTLYTSQVEVNDNVAHTSAAGTPFGGRHCNSTSWSRDTSFPKGSCSNDFFRSEETKRDKKMSDCATGVYNDNFRNAPFHCILKPGIITLFLSFKIVDKVIS